MKNPFNPKKSNIHFALSIVLLISFIIAGGVFFGVLSQYENSSSKEDPKDSTSTTTIETDTGKRLQTLANSGTNWGMSPFGTGKPLTETEETPSTPTFQKPNTEWKTRTISGVTYVFGEGNPQEVALPESEMAGCSFQEAGIQECTDNGAGYVDPILEKLVYDLLNSPDWEPLLRNCEHDLRIVDAFLSTSGNYSVTYEVLWNLRQYISLEEIFLVNPETGRKNISKEGYGKLMAIYGYLQMGTSDFEGNPLPGVTNCVDTYGINIANMLINIRGLPWRGSKDLPPNQGGWDGKLIPLEQSF